MKFIENFENADLWFANNTQTIYQLLPCAVEIFIFEYFVHPAIKIVCLPFFPSPSVELVLASVNISFCTMGFILFISGPGPSRQQTVGSRGEIFNFFALDFWGRFQIIEELGSREKALSKIHFKFHFFGGNLLGEAHRMNKLKPTYHQHNADLMHSARRTESRACYFFHYKVVAGWMCENRVFSGLQISLDLWFNSHNCTLCQLTNKTFRCNLHFTQICTAVHSKHYFTSGNAKFRKFCFYYS